jgi:RNA polymerase sigma-70 factor, ECF subfamily
VPPGSSGAALGLVAEAPLVALAAGGDVAAFTELVQRRQSWLRNLLRRLSRDPALADDLAQQVFLQAWQALPRLRSMSAFGAWLRRLALNAWLAHVRAAAPAALSLDELEPAAVPQVAPGSGADLDLDRALARLAPQERLCVVLAYGEGMSHGEISTATNLPLGTVKSHVRRGALRLRALLHPYQTTEDHAHAG